MTNWIHKAFLKVNNCKSMYSYLKILKYPYFTICYMYIKYKFVPLPLLMVIIIQSEWYDLLWISWTSTKQTKKINKILIFDYSILHFFKHNNLRQKISKTFTSILDLSEKNIRVQSLEFQFSYFYAWCYFYLYYEICFFFQAIWPFLENIETA